VAAKLLTVEDGKCLFEFRGRRRLFDPTAMPTFLIRPSDQVRRNNLWDAAGDAALAFHVKIPGR
jgi:hypothetical protein